ncbi:MAG TPA: glycosyltransferase [Mycobacteriales bacterium]|nr:glycosyltransferase [Mycobacteriales bacterium]
MDVITLPTSDAPRVSVIVLSMHSPWLLAECLTSVGAHAGSQVPYEVILVCNGATPDLVLFAQRKLRGVRVVVSAVNLGFGGGNTYAATLARGELLLLLNDDVTVEPGWLDALVTAADEHPEAAAVGSRILFPDGTLQEAGSVLWADGSTAPVGRGLPADTDAYNFRRHVDYISACSLLVRKSAFDAVGGFDPRYHPAYYEDVDFCLELRQRGHRVLYEPASRIRHHESQSTQLRFKQFLFQRNGAAFRDKWADQIADQEPADPTSPAAVERAVHRGRGKPPRLLLIDDMLPDPGLGAGFGRTHDLISELAFDRWAITFHATNHRNADSAALGRFGVELVRGEVEEMIEHLAAPGVHYDVVVVSRPHNWEFFAEAIRGTQPGAVLVYDAEALFHVRLERQAAMATGKAAAKLRQEAAKYRALEEQITRLSDHVVSVSPDEAAWFASVPEHAPVTVVEPLTPGIDVTPTGPGRRRDLVYVAGWLARDADSPNADGLRWFAEQVLPLLTAALPWVRLLVTGANPPASVRRLAGPHLEFVGYVQDLAQLYDSARVVISPIRYGAGVKIKTVEALQYGVPTVTTSHGAEGIVLGSTAPLAVADDAAGFVAHLHRLLVDDAAWRAQRAEIETLLQIWKATGRTAVWPDVLDTALKEGRREFVALRA